MADSPSTDAGGPKTEYPCPDCGEMVREGLVRCWNCGGFLRSDMEERFQKMQQQPTQVIYSSVEAASNEDIEGLLSAAVSGGGEDTDDFQLAGDVASVGGPTIQGAQEDDQTGTDDEKKSPEASTSTDAEKGDAKSKDAAGNGKPTKGDGKTDDAVPHSIATGGDALLELATAEETEKSKRKGSRSTSLEGVKAIRDGFLIDAPKGCRIQVRDERTGEMRRLTFGASSRVRISMLDKLEAIAKAKEEAAGKEGQAGEKQQKHLSAGKYDRWMSDLHLHTINPAKLKLVADSLTKDFQLVEVGFAKDELLTVSLPAAKKGLFGGGKGASTPEEAQEALFAHLKAGKSLEGKEVSVAGDVQKSYTADQVAELRVVQPVASLTDSLFAGIPVFGGGRIAVQLPVTEAGEQPKLLSFTVSQFREFDKVVGTIYSMEEFGRNLGIPLEDSFTEHKCHFLDISFKALEHIEFYNADETLETVLAGYLCGECGIAVSEAGRQKEKLGGKAGKGIAKAKCPKCEKKMGNNPLFTLVGADAEPSMSGEESSTSARASNESTKAAVSKEEAPKDDAPKAESSKEAGSDTKPETD